MTQASEKRLFYQRYHRWHVKITAKGTEAETRVLTAYTVRGNANPLTFWRWILSFSLPPGLSTFIWDDFQNRTAKRTVLEQIQSQRYWKGLYLHSGSYYRDKAMHTIMVSCQLKVLWSNAILFSESGNYDLCHVLLESMKLYLQILMHSIIALC